MKQKIEFEIEVPEGKRAVWKGNKIVFEDINPQLPKTWKEFCNTHPIVNTEYFIGITSTTGAYMPKTEVTRRRDIDCDRHLLESEDDVVAHIALVQLHRLRDCYRQGWKPNWSESLEVKYCIKSFDNTLDIYTHNLTKEFLAFQSKEIATEFLNNFRDLIEQAGDLI